MISQTPYDEIISQGKNNEVIHTVEGRVKTRARTKVTLRVRVRVQVQEKKEHQPPRRNRSRSTGTPRYRSIASLGKMPAEPINLQIKNFIFNITSFGKVLN